MAYHRITRAIRINLCVALKIPSAGRRRRRVGARPTDHEPGAAAYLPRIVVSDERSLDSSSGLSFGTTDASGGVSLPLPGAQPDPILRGAAQWMVPDGRFHFVAR